MPRTYVDNAYNRRIGRVGMPVGTMVVSRTSGTPVICEKSYVDNEYNRRLGRVGLPRGSMPLSEINRSSPERYITPTISKDRSKPSNVDNYRNDFEHKGIPCAKKPISKSPSMPISNTSRRTSDDQYFNNLLDFPEDWHAESKTPGYYQMPEGNMPFQKSIRPVKDKHEDNSRSNAKATYSAKAYKDRKKEYAEILRSGTTVPKSASSKPGKAMDPDEYTYRERFDDDKEVVPKQQMLRAFTEESEFSNEMKTYKDNPHNRNHDRVGLPVGSKVISKSSQKAKVKFYRNNKMNRKLGRVGKPLGSMPVSKSSKTTETTKEAYHYFMNHQVEDIKWNLWSGTLDQVEREHLQETVLSLLQRSEQVQQWQLETRTTEQPITSSLLLDKSSSTNQKELQTEDDWLEDLGATGGATASCKLSEKYEGQIIDYQDLEIGKKIGFGAYGDVHFAKWKGTVVAVKKLRIQRIARWRLKQFTDEVKLFCQLDHPNIVRFLGACDKPPDLAIVMEYMQCSLFEALHYLNDFELTENSKISITHQTALGIDYLHGKDIAHCDIKTSNILLDTRIKEDIIAKLTDFGLSMMKAETESSASSKNFVQNVGTPRYSAPEVLRGEILDLPQMKMADMYSYSLVVYEIVYECEPFPTLNYHQLCTQVGEKKITPDIPESVDITPELLVEFHKCWSRNPEERSMAIDFAHCIEGLNNIYKN